MLRNCDSIAYGRGETALWPGSNGTLAALGEARFVDVMDLGWWVGGVLLILSVAALAIIFLKLVQFRRLALRADRDAERALSMVQRREFAQAREELSSHRHPSAHVLAFALAHHADPQSSRETLADEVQCAAEREMEHLEWGLRPLSAIAQLSPLLGLLGTVLGMIRAFADLENAADQVNPALLAGGIWQALLTTAMGLAIAIPTRAVLYYLEARVERAGMSMQHVATRALHVLGVPTEPAKLTGRAVSPDPQPDRKGTDSSC